MTALTPFKPSQATGQKVTATTTSQNITIGKDCRSIRAMNTGAVVVYFRTYRAADGAKTATTADTPLNIFNGDGACLVVEVPIDHDTLAYVADSTTSVCYFQAGEGGR